jgi:hypothetical protein
MSSAPDHHVIEFKLHIWQRQRRTPVDGKLLKAGVGSHLYERKITSEVLQKTAGKDAAPLGIRQVRCCGKCSVIKAPGDPDL